MLSLSFLVPSSRMCVCMRVGGGWGEKSLCRGKAGQLKGERGKEARIRTTGRLAEVGAIVAVPPPGTARGAAVVHLQMARATDSGARDRNITLCVSLPNSLSLSHEFPALLNGVGVG